MEFDPKTLRIGGMLLELPLLFPSVSSVKSNFSPHDLVSLLVALDAPAFLVSAYDLGHSEKRVEFLQLLATAHERNKVVLLDSGNYESYWHNDSEWSVARFHEQLKDAKTPLAFIHDNQSPPDSSLAIAQDVEAAVLRDQSVATAQSAVPIVHGTKSSLPEACAITARLTQSPIIAIAERELGNGLLERAKTTRAVRKAVTKVNADTAIHILGTGNPLTILILALAGAQTFDGLEWCQTCVDPDTARLLHFQQRDLVRDLCDQESLSYPLATLSHNLTFFSDWMKRVREALMAGTAYELLAEYTSPAISASFKEALA